MARSSPTVQITSPPPGRRGYHQYCGLARALDAVGERWTLLVVRELITGPKRFSDLLGALPGLSASLLASRLRGLERDGLVRRDRLPPPAASAVYRLTSDGEELGDVVKRLALWGLRLLDRVGPGDAFRPGWLAFYFDLVADRARAVGVHDVYEFHVDADAFHVVVDDGRIEVREGPAPLRADVVSWWEMAAFAEVGAGRLDPAEAAGQGRVRVEGDEAAIARSLAILNPAARLGQAAR